MHISGFECHAPTRLSETFGILDQYGPDARPLAGGADLLLDMKHGLKLRHVVGLGGLKQLMKIELEDSRIRLGPYVRSQP